MAKRLRYSVDLARSICAEVSKMSVTRVVKLDGMPCESTIYEWLQKHEEFAEMYARACEFRSEREAEAIVEIADAATPEDVQVAKLRVEARKWVASKLAPRKYGDRQTVEHEGGISLQVVTGVPSREGV